MIVSLPPRKVASSPQGVISGVASLNNLTGDLTLTEGAGVTITRIDAGTLQISAAVGAYVQKSGDTVLGNLVFSPTAGDFGLALAVISADPAASMQGGVYYNSTSNTVRIASAAGWGPLVPDASAVTSITAGTGLLGGTLNGSHPTGTFTLDFGVTSAAWAGAHSFLQPVSFASTQTFAVSELRVPSHTAFDLLIAQSPTTWDRLGVGTEGQIMAVTGGKPTWVTVSQPSLPASCPQWQKVSLSYSAFTGAGQIAQQVCLTLPAGGFVHAVKIKHSAAFKGGSISGATVSVGTAPTPIKYSAAFNVFAPSGDTVMGNYLTEGGENHAAPTSLYATLTVMGGMLTALNTGSVDIWIMVSQAI